MRFEQMGFDDQVKRLRQIQVRLNNTMYSGELMLIPVDIVNLNADAWAGYKKPCDLVPYGKIMIDHNYIVEVVATAKTIREQKYLLALMILHEMAHQYCYEHWLDDNNHGTEWQKVANEHGLDVHYDNGKLIHEDLRSVVYVALASL